MNFSEALRAFDLHLLAERSFSQHTRRAYVADVRQFAQFVGQGTEPAEVTATHVRAFLADLHGLGGRPGRSAGGGCPRRRRIARQQGRPAGQPQQDHTDQRTSPTVHLFSLSGLSTNRPEYASAARL